MGIGQQLVVKAEMLAGEVTREIPVGLGTNLI